MDLCDKKAWLNKHGKLSFTFVNHGKTCFTKHWTSRGGVRFSGVGDNEEAMYEKVFEKVKETLFVACA